MIEAVHSFFWFVGAWTTVSLLLAALFILLKEPGR